MSQDEALEAGLHRDKHWQYFDVLLAASCCSIGLGMQQPAQLHEVSSMLPSCMQHGPDSTDHSQADPSRAGLSVACAVVLRS